MKQHRNNLDLVRLVLAIGVLFSHGFELVDGNRNREPFARLLNGRTAAEFCVLAFFVLSGYLVCKSWRSDPDAIRFLIRRLARIVPGFLVCSLACALLFGPIASGSERYWSDFSVRVYLFSLINLHGPMIPPVFAGSHYPVINGSMWTIRLEFRCYLWALLLGSMNLARPPIVWLVCAMALGLAGLFPAVLASLTFRGDYWTTGPILEIVPLLFAFSSGALLCFVRQSWLNHSALLLALPAGLILSKSFPTTANLLLPAAMGCFVLGLGSLQWAWLIRLRPKWDISYGFYLYAWPIQKLLLLGWPALDPYVLFAVALPLTAVVATLSWLIVERPSLQFAQRWLSNRTARNPGLLKV